jgi:hypothetical protein
VGRVHADQPPAASALDADTPAFAHRMFDLASEGRTAELSVADLLQHGRPT